MAPHVPHVPAAVHWRPVLQVSPAQHASPDAPQLVQTPTRQTSPVLHTSPGQHTSPAAPQAAHVTPLQASPEPVHTLPVQQA
jgi:hypothetical protein